MRSADLHQTPHLFGIIGYPLRLTHSPAIHNAAFASCKLPHIYAPFRVAPTDLKKSLTHLSALDVHGLNVTYPHKSATCAHVRTLTPLARTLGAVNTLVRRRGGWHGDNTDVAGFLAPLATRRKGLRNKPAVVFGSGGAARAVVYALVVECRVSAVLVVGRSAGRSQLFMNWASGLDPSVPVSFARLTHSEDWIAAFKEAKLVVNATPVGMNSGSQKLLPPRTTFRPTQIVYDLVYGTDTHLVKRAQKAKARVITGEVMLLAQAARSFELWTGVEFPVRKVKRALKGIV